MATEAALTKADERWETYVKGLLRAEMARRSATYRDLAAKLTEVGVRETETNLRSKVSRGSFTAVFFIQALSVLGCSSLRIEDTPKNGVDTAS